MSCCPHCRDAEDLFSDRTARRDLRRYRRRGPVRTTRMLIDALRPHLRTGWTLLDVGGGVGAIQHELLAGPAPGAEDPGAPSPSLAAAVQVDASRAYLDAAREEAARRGHGDRVEHVHGDFVEAAAAVAAADVVTLDRVICCYPYMERLVAASAGKASHVYGLVYPRDSWHVRAAVALGNLYLRMRRSAFRSHVHSGAAVDAALRGAGFEPASRARTLIWHVATYTRTSALRA